MKHAWVLTKALVKISFFNDEMHDVPLHASPARILMLIKMRIE